MTRPPSNPLLVEVAPLLDALAAGAGASDDARRFPAEQAAALASAGVFRATVPRSLGGLETPLPELTEVIEAVARRHGSAGWCVMIGTTTALLSAYLPRQAAADIYGGDPEVITGGAYAPTGRAVRLPDGALEVSGRWEWGSGSANCAWLLGGALVLDDDGEVATGPSGLPEMRLCFAPAAEVGVVSNWDVLGMRGTGSDDLVMEGVRVPPERTVSLVDDRPWADGPLYRFPPFGLLALGIGAVALGVARSAMDAFVELAVGKVPMMSARVLSSRATVRAEVGRAEADLRSAAAFYRDEVASAWAAAESGADFDVAQRAALRLAATHAATVAADVCARLHRLGGGTTVRHGQTLERTLRDSHTATQHILVSWSMYETVGGVLLGAEPGMLEL